TLRPGVDGLRDADPRWVFRYPAAASLGDRQPAPAYACGGADRAYPRRTQGTRAPGRDGWAHGQAGGAVTTARADPVLGHSTPSTIGSTAHAITTALGKTRLPGLA